MTSDCDARACDSLYINVNLRTQKRVWTGIHDIIRVGLVLVSVVVGEVGEGGLGLDSSQPGPFSLQRIYTIETNVYLSSSMSRTHETPEAMPFPAGATPYSAEFASMRLRSALIIYHIGC